MADPTSSFPQNSYDALSSKLKRLYIPLPHYKIFHRAPSENDGKGDHFIEREANSSRLKTWLSDESGESKGSYLITGYRGMGKSSFVDRVICDIIGKDKTKEEKKKEKEKEKKDKSLTSWLRKCWRPTTYLLLFIFIVIFIILLIKCEQHDCVFSGMCLLLLLILIGYWGLALRKSSHKPHIHHIKVNLGSEINSEREVLALIANAIRLDFMRYHSTKHNLNSTILFYRIWGVVIFSFLMLGVYKLFPLLETAAQNFLKSGSKKWLHQVILFINNFFFEIRETPILGSVGAFILACSVAFLLYKCVVKFIGFIAKETGHGHKYVSGKKALAQLEYCCERIDAAIDEGTYRQGIINIGGNSFGRKKSKIRRYSYATVREIEQELIQITTLFRESKFIRSRLIIVLDELDKIIVSNRNNKAEKVDASKPELPEFAYDSSFPGSNSARIKKQNVLYLLAQLKYFISSADAKFVFISGRELYDAFLADVSDREFSISSIFNGVINVDSFFSYNTQTKDITKMTEMYLCKQLREEETVRKEQEGKTRPVPKDSELYTLKAYYDDLIKDNEIGKDGDSLSPKKEIEEIKKIIAFLNQFVTYLTYLSNGAPKKLTTNLEEHIITRDQYLNQKKDPQVQYINVSEHPDQKKKGEETSEFYLSFGYYDQQRIGFLHYMTYPIFQTIISPSSEYGDKLLISASFLIGHIYKHHSGGFSWRDLEYIPELMESHRTPELRDFISSLISYLGQIHFNQITTGLYQYKFPMKLYEEISVFSKKSEEISAVFNFSRDDSRSVKQYFANMIEYHSKHADYSPIILANLHQYMGDLYLVSEEYTEAINQYRTAKDITANELALKADGPDKNNPSLVSRLVRSMLKMGLAYEKRNTVDSAYLAYSELVNLLISNRHVDENDLELDYRLDKHDSEDFWDGYRILLFQELNPFRLKSEQFQRKIHPKFITEDEEKEIKYWSYSNELIPNLAYHLTPEKSNLISNLAMYEDLRVAYQPLLAKLFAIEKLNVCGITPGNLTVIEAEFRNLFLTTNNEEKYILSADFFRKLGDILYYKNSDFGLDYNNIPVLLDIWGYNLKMAVFNYCYNNDIPKEITESMIKALTNMTVSKEYKNMLKGCANTLSAEDKKRFKYFLKSDFGKLPKHVLDRLPTIDKCLERRILFGKKRNEDNTFYRKTLPCQACKYYNRSLAVLVKKFIPEELNVTLRNEKPDMSKCIRLLIFIKTRNISLRERNLTQVALSLESMGSIMLCCSGKEDILSKKFVETMTLLLEKNYDKEKIIGGLKETFCQLEKAILNYYAAGLYYQKAGNTRQTMQCYVKIFNLMVSYIVDVKKDSKGYYTHIASEEFGTFVQRLYKDLLSEAIFCAYSNRDFQSLTEGAKFGKKIKLSYTSLMPDIEEALYAYYKIWIELERKGVIIVNETEYRPMSIFSDEELKAIYHSDSLTSLRIESLTYTRIMSLLFKVDLNFLMIDRMMKSLGLKRNVFSKAANCDFEDVFIAARYRRRFFIESRCHGAVLKEMKIGNGTFPRILAEIKKLLSPDESKTHGSNFEAFEFLITDSIFCLTNIIGFLSPTFRSTSFTNGFCGDIYKKLLEWLRIKEFLDGFYKKEMKGNPDRTRFKNYFDSKIDSSAKGMLKKTFLGEMAVKYYEKAAEMNSEGQYYQDFIRSLTIADDDLQNDACQFYLAQERYKLNIDSLYKRSDQIKQYAKISDNHSLSGSHCYQGLSYFKEKRIK